MRRGNGRRAWVLWLAFLLLQYLHPASTAIAGEAPDPTADLPALAQTIDEALQGRGQIDDVAHVLDDVIHHDDVRALEGRAVEGGSGL